MAYKINRWEKLVAEGLPREGSNFWKREVGPGLKIEY